VVLLHQTPRSVDEFTEVLPLLAREQRVIAIDTPGYGCSDRVPGQPSIGDYAGSVLAVLDELRVQRVCLVGHHTGAVIAVELAAGHPDRVERVALSGPVYTDAAGRAALARHFAQWRVRPDGSHLMEKWKKLLGWCSDPALAQRVLVDLLRAGESSEQGHFAVAAYRMEDRLPLVRCSGLLLHGRRDPFSAPERTEPLRRALGPAREAFLDAGVFAPSEAPAAYAAAVLGFLGANADCSGACAD
jgi:pimeloyl-ACP methyl ester carboxylesterase